MFADSPWEEFEIPEKKKNKHLIYFVRIQQQYTVLELLNNITDGDSVLAATATLRADGYLQSGGNIQVPFPSTQKQCSKGLCLLQGTLLSLMSMKNL